MAARVHYSLPFLGRPGPRWPRSPWRRDRVPDAFEVMAVFDPDFPGRGPDAFRVEPLDHAMAYGVFATAAATLGETTPTRRAADWLLANAIRRDGAVGWGLPFESATFGKTVPNPIDTIYAITNSEVIRGLIGYYKLSKENFLLEECYRSLQYYKKLIYQNAKSSYFCYSNAKGDDKNVYNATSMLMGMYFIVGELIGSKDFLCIGNLLFESLWQCKKQDKNGIYWSYGDYTERPNDLVHAAFIVQGILEGNRRRADPVDLDPALAYLEGFISRNRVYEYHPAVTLSKRQHRRPARLWGLGMLIATLADAGRYRTAETAARALRAYEFAPNRFANVPGETVWTPRMQAYALLGLARLRSCKAVGEREALRR